MRRTACPLVWSEVGQRGKRSEAKGFVIYIQPGYVNARAGSGRRVRDLRACLCESDEREA